MKSAPKFPASMSAPSQRLLYLSFALIIFIGAFLVFLVQPLIARYILPWFGGSRSVWTASMLFFQVGLLAGYGYAFGLSRWLKADKQLLVHVVLLVVSALFLPITPDASMKPEVASTAPAAQVILLLVVTVGVPYAILSSTGPLFQHWFALWKPGKSPFWFYSLSNVGSLLGLLIYPFVIEPNLRLQHQTVLWSAIYGLFLAIGLLLLFGLRTQKLSSNPPAVPDDDQDTSPDKSLLQQLANTQTVDLLLWVVLAACGTVTLLSTTDFMSQDLGVIPFFWIIPLCLYLLTFILTFAGERFYQRWFWLPLLLLVMQPLFGLLQDHYAYNRPDLLYSICIYLLGMFATVMICHGELFRIRPQASRLTLFYLMVSFGGALGGLFVTFVAPVLFSDYWEFPLSFIGCIFLVAVCFVRSGGFSELMPPKPWKERIPVMGFVVLLFVGHGGYYTEQLLSFRDAFSENVLVQYRNFYGVARVVEEDEDTYLHRYELVHGQINHGTQLQDPDLELFATTYYSTISGVGRAILRHPKRLEGAPMKVGIIGLGAGTLGAYEQEGDTYIYYEIDPNIDLLAYEYFTFMREINGEPHVVLGDGRLSLERELKADGSQNFDVLVIDAFSGDAIPVHLLTREAFALYAQHLAEGGVIAVHISNRYFRLEPLLYTTAQDMGLHPLLMLNGEEELEVHSALWALLTDNTALLEDSVITDAASSWEEWEDAEPVRWTDDYSSLLDLLDLELQHESEF